jgi:zinc transporter ZupT
VIIDGDVIGSNFEPCPHWQVRAAARAGRAAPAAAMTLANAGSCRGPGRVAAKYAARKKGSVGPLSESVLPFTQASMIVTVVSMLVPASLS